MHGADTKKEKLEFLRQISEKYAHIKFHENTSSFSLRTDRRTDGRDETNSRFSKFCESP